MGQVEIVSFGNPTVDEVALMGVQDKVPGSPTDDRRRFMKRLLRDVRALENMLEGGMIESGIRRIGAEQELFIVDSSYRPAPRATEILAKMNEPLFGHELGLYNLECSVDPVVFGGTCMSQMEAQLTDLISRAREAAHSYNTHLILTGILPSIEKSDLGLHNVTPNPRYKLLNDTLGELRGRAYEISIKGLDELKLQHDSVMLESANTSFQVHFQVGPQEFCRLYNVAQAVTAPVLAAATNSPLLFGKRLWRETRIALFQQSVDTRQSNHYIRETQPRVSFGTDWVRQSVLDIYHDDIARFRVLFPAEEGEDSLEVLESGQVPKLSALCLHNSTIYRWNRACYGISEGKPHLRIENRVLPSGPTPLDEMANAAFWFGLMSGTLEEFGDVTRHMDFSDARGNFVAAARHGLSAPITWLNGKTLAAHELIEQQLIPLAREGLVESGIASSDIDRYMDVITERVRTRQTGSEWMLKSFTSLRRTRSVSDTITALTAATIKRQIDGKPVHEWSLADQTDRAAWKDNFSRVGQFMSRDLFTLKKDETVEFAASLMSWHHIHWIPVEDNAQNLVGLLTHDQLLRLFADTTGDLNEVGSKLVEEVMDRDIPSIPPETSTIDAVRLMQTHRISCLPVVESQKLVGIVTEADILDITRQLLEEQFGPHAEASKPAASASSSKNEPVITSLAQAVADATPEEPAAPSAAIEVELDS